MHCVAIYGRLYGYTTLQYNSNNNHHDIPLVDYMIVITASVIIIQ